MPFSLQKDTNSRENRGLAFFLASHPLFDEVGVDLAFDELGGFHHLLVEADRGGEAGDRAFA